MEGTYWKIKKYLEKVSKELEAVLRDLDDECVKARENGVPIYLTKGRVKTLDSLYLKTKRKGDDYLDITDIAGFRVLCLFEKDLLSVHEFLLRLFNRDYVAKKCIVYNWDELSPFYSELIRRAESVYKRITFPIERKDKISGYRSIHYLVEKETRSRVFKMEVQLRTIAQDVWGEIEHEIAYKKASVRPYVKESVRLLAKDLQNIDDLFSHLRNIQEKELGGDYYSSYGQGPKNVLDYEANVIDEVFDNEKLRNLYDNYFDCLKGYNRDARGELWVREMRFNLSNIKGELKSRSEDCWVKYWLDMEEAFLDFCECRYDDALNKYLKVELEHKERYCVYFRIGELYSLVGDMVTSLAYFDKVENLISLYGKNDYLNQFRINMRLAMVYWSLGGGFIDTAIQNIDEAEKIYYKHKSKKDRNGEAIFFQEHYSKLINNLCYYYLERYLYAKENMGKDKEAESHLNDCYSAADKKYRKLSRIISGGNINRNTLDTASWFLYHKYLLTGEKKLLKKAMDLCLSMKEYENKTVYSIKSLNLQKDHVQEIMSKADEVLGLRRENKLGYPIVKSQFLGK
ncbi:RelA/SpoT domain protein [Prosthecochloris aestuarii DSM 271]|uniref:RelA/SpoT domain protein n=1 Tax=Prosthecochloris aestuarii (strain DSM 271 / SK 413) TaxID=290512 RepID=B4S9A1_PROA2|nr:RelA/SpoT domain-containing protein [Prosthecochloris aestuarii]ACF45133.1 RelA/SpoT domain protein [Prosthecochloris aestuarii DSM 271]